MDEIASFGAWLKQRRRAPDLTQDELARRLGCALGTVRKWETEERGHRRWSPCAWRNCWRYQLPSDPPSSGWHGRAGRRPAPVGHPICATPPPNGHGHLAVY